MGFKEGDILRTVLDAAAWKRKYPNNTYEELWYHYGGTISKASYALQPGYCGGTELRDWDKDDFKLVNGICDECDGRGRVGEKVRIIGRVF